MVVESSPKYQSKSNGVIERGVQSIEYQMRVARSALEERLGMKVEVNSAVWPWLTEHVAVLLNRLEVGADGRTAYERCKGKRAKMLGYEFGEMVLWRGRPIGRRLAKLECLWEDGVYLGIKATTGEYIVGDSKGVRQGWIFMFLGGRTRGVKSDKIGKEFLQKLESDLVVQSSR